MERVSKSFKERDGPVKINLHTESTRGIKVSLGRPAGPAGPAAGLALVHRALVVISECGRVISVWDVQKR